VHAHGELINTSLLGTDLVDLDLGIRHTTAEARTDVRLLVAVAVAASWAASHFEKFGEVRKIKKIKKSKTEKYKKPQKK